VLCLAGVIATAATAATVDKSKWPARMTFASGPVGGFAYTTGSPWASVIGAEIGVPISVESTAGFPINLLMVDSRKAEIGMSTTDLTYQGWDGADWSEKKQLRSQRTVMVLGANALQIYTSRNSGVKSIADIAGRTVNPSRRRSGADLIFRDVVEALGIKPARISNVAPAEANTLLADGRLDVAAVTGSTPHPALSEFDASHDMAVIGLTEAELKRYLQKHPYMGGYELAAGTYKGLKEPVKTVASYIVMVVRADAPDSLVYALVKSTYEKKGALAGAHKSFAAIDPKDIVHATVPVHPGAVKYYQERGVTLPAKLTATK
jgi:TRAP transporter TAXI family solute receptor